MKRSFFCIAVLLFLGAGCGSATSQPAVSNFPTVTPNTNVPTQPALPPLADPMTNAGMLPSTTSSTPQFSLDARVYAAWKNGAVWYPGKISALSGNLYTVIYDNGDTETNVTAPRLVLQSNGPVSDTFKSGESVIARAANGSWYKGAVYKDAGNLITINFEDKTQDAVVRNFIIPFTAHTAGATTSTAKSTSTDTFPTGTHVLADWHAGPRWWDATVTGKNAGGYTIVYSDDHSSDTLPASSLANYPTDAKIPTAGEKIIAHSTNNYWYSATVDTIAKGIISITFFDGYKQVISANNFAVAGS